jgi:hypothetical protein
MDRLQPTESPSTPGTRNQTTRTQRAIYGRGYQSPSTSRRTGRIAERRCRVRHRLRRTPTLGRFLFLLRCTSAPAPSSTHLRRVPTQFGAQSHSLPPIRSLGFCCPLQSFTTQSKIGNGTPKPVTSHRPSPHRNSLPRSRIAHTQPNLFSPRAHALCPPAHALCPPLQRRPTPPLSLPYPSPTPLYLGHPGCWKETREQTTRPIPTGGQQWKCYFPPPSHPYPHGDRHSRLNSFARLSHPLHGLHLHGDRPLLPNPPANRTPTYPAAQTAAPS